MGTIQEDVGYIKGKVDVMSEIVERMDVRGHDMDNRLRAVEGRVSNMLAWASGAAFVVSFTVVVLKQWIFSLFNKHS